MLLDRIRNNIIHRVTPHSSHASWGSFVVNDTFATSTHNRGGKASAYSVARLEDRAPPFAVRDGGVRARTRPAIVSRGGGIRSTEEAGADESTSVRSRDGDMRTNYEDLADHAPCCDEFPVFLKP